MIALSACLLGSVLNPPSVYAEIRTITVTDEYTMVEVEAPLVAKGRFAIQAMRAASEKALEGIAFGGKTLRKHLEVINH